MLNNPTTVGASIGNSLAAPSKPNPKSVTIAPALNGFVIQMTRVNEYGIDYSIAANVEDITKVLQDYFAA